MLTLYGSAGSGSATIEVALVHCKLRYRLVNAATWEPDSALGELERVKPLRQIPVLVLADSSVLTESSAILIHLGLSYPASGLLSAAPRSRDQDIRAPIFIAASCHAAIGVIDHPERWGRGATAPMLQRVRRAARARLHRHWVIFADQFPTRGAFLRGDTPGAADLLAAVVSKWSGAHARLRKLRPSCTA